jgi:hypothetical protein
MISEKVFGESGIPLIVKLIALALLAGGPLMRPLISPLIDSVFPQIMDSLKKNSFLPSFLSRTAPPMLSPSSECKKVFENLDKRIETAIVNGSANFPNWRFS